MSRKISRPRRHIVCTTCGRKTSTTYPPESGDLCLPCRAAGHNGWTGMDSKHDLDAMLGGGAA
jgi:hypothetical protein